MAHKVRRPSKIEDLAALDARSRDYADATRAETTKMAYQDDWRYFCTWCDAHHLTSLPADKSTIIRYVTMLADDGKSLSTIKRRMSAIGLMHELADFASPTQETEVRQMLRGVARRIGRAQQGKTPILLEDLIAMLNTLDDDGLATIRNRALLLIGFAGAFRRSELVSIQMRDLEFVSSGLVITLRRSKTDQEGEGRRVGIPYGRQENTCPVRALQAWIARGGFVHGPVFRGVSKRKVTPNQLSGWGVARVVKRAAAAAGLDATRYSGHSLRAGLATSAAAMDVDERTIMQQTGHKSVQMVRKYIREGNLFKRNAAGQVGL